MTIGDLREHYSQQIAALEICLLRLRKKYSTLESREALPGGALMRASRIWTSRTALANREHCLNEELNRLRGLIDATRQV